MAFLPWRIRDFKDYDVNAFGAIALRFCGKTVVNRDRVKHITVPA
jgi:hypothetical protein